MSGQSRLSAVLQTIADQARPVPARYVDVVDMWSEARIYDAVKIVDGGSRNTALWQHILDTDDTPRYTRQQCFEQTSQFPRIASPG